MVACSVAVCGAMTAGWPPAEAAAATPGCGQVILSGSSWLGGGGVDVHSNGGEQGTGVNCGSDSTSNPDVQDGNAWQCVELVARLYHVKGWGDVHTSTGGASSIPEGSPGLDWHPNGTGYAPVPGDLVIYNPTGTNAFGHASVVDSVAGATVNVVEQNASWSARDTLTLAGSMVEGGVGGVRGVIHAPANKLTGDVLQWNADPSAQKAAWRVGLDGRRHWIPTTTDYWCLINGGVPGPYAMPADFLSNVVPDDSGSSAPCGADINGDGIVDISDLSIMASEWGTAGHRGDINLDGTVNISDLSLMAAQWHHKAAPIAILPPNVARATGTPASATAIPGVLPVPAGWTRPAILARPTESGVVGGVAGNDVSVSPSISGDGNIVVFSSFASNLVPGDTNGVLDVFAWNRSAGTLTRVSTGSGGGQLTTPSSDAEISPNGQYVVFDSGSDVYAKDMRTGALLRISQPNADPSAEPDAAAYADNVTSSGLVVFESKADNLVAGDSNGASDVFVRPLQDGPVEQVSITSDAGGGTELGTDSDAGAASDDGRFVTFASGGAVYVRDRALGTTTIVSNPASGQADGPAGFPSISANGRYVAFNSAATNLVPGNATGFAQVYVRDTMTGALMRVSQGNSGTAGNGDSTEPSISADGTRVAFRSDAGNLVARDTNYAEDVFVADLARHAISRVSVTATLAQGNSSTFGPALNANGTVVAYPTDATNLTGAAAGTPEQVLARVITSLPMSPATPAITGTAKVGNTLTAHAGTWDPATAALRYQWYADATAITGATGATLKVTAAQYGKAITVRVTASLAGFATASATSKATAKVAAGTLTAATPSITGTAKADTTLTASPGTWGPSPVTLKYQWYVNGKAVSGGTSRMLKLSVTWAGRTVTVKVTGSKPGYVTTAKMSKPTKKITR
jgi:Tol biopolymer transport system component